MKLDYQKEAKGLIKGRVLFDVPMRKYTSLKVGGPAECLLFPKDIKELRKVILHARRKNIPLFVLGKGTNLIVRDRGISGWVVSLTQGMKRIRMDGEYLEAEAGCLLQQLVQISVQKGLAGLEPFFGIPGTVGGGLAMNAGAWGVEMKDVVHSVILMKGDGEVVEKPRSKLRFSYRSLTLPSSSIILKGSFHLRKGRREEGLERVKSFSELRKKNHPLDYPSAGSVFKNPKEGPAGRWIDEIGLKGFSIGQAMISNRHANFIVNQGKASAEDVLHLIEWVEKRVYEEKGISLEREVRVVGEA
jgi:UDP-N-acetylmuramate dehydrogenase